MSDKDQISRVMISGGFDNVVRIGRDYSDSKAVVQERMDDSDSTSVRTKFVGYMPSISALVNDETGEIIGEYVVENSKKLMNKIFFELWETDDVSIIEADEFYHLVGYYQQADKDATEFATKDRKTGKKVMKKLDKRMTTTIIIQEIEKVDKPAYFAAERTKAKSSLAKAKLSDIPLLKSWDEKQAEMFAGAEEKEASTEEK